MSGLVSSLDVSKEIAAILVSRGITDKEKADIFFNPNLEKIKPPIGSIAFKKASELICEIIYKRGKIFIFGDYDVDGTCSTAILYDFFKKLGMQVSYYLPNRFSEGYGLNIKAIDHMAKDGANLIITVDCGITNFEEIEHIKRLGIKVIITDHHSLPSILPNADVILHSAIKDCSFEFNFFAGVGVAYYFLIVLRRLLIDRGIIKAHEVNTKFNLKKYLDLVALATIADVAPLVDENRILVKNGLEVIEKTEKTGLYYLKQLSGVFGKVSTFDVGFKLAPRLNAAGRMGEASRVVELLTSSDENKTLSIARELHNENNNRKTTQEAIMENISEIIAIEPNKYKNCILIYSDLWHEGILGICASKLVDKYNVPVILLSLSEGKGVGEERTLKGSGRSIGALNLHDALLELNLKNKLFLKFGGHSAAIGLSMKESKFDFFVQEFNNYLKHHLKEEDYIPSGHVDASISLNEIDMELVNFLTKMEPHGEGNPVPVFKTENVVVDDFKIIKDRHWKGYLLDTETGVRCEAIAFNMAEKFPTNKERISIIHSIEINKFNGRETIQLNIKDVVPLKGSYDFNQV